MKIKFYNDTVTLTGHYDAVDKCNFLSGALAMFEHLYTDNISVSITNEAKENQEIVIKILSSELIHPLKAFIFNMLEEFEEVSYLNR